MKTSIPLLTLLSAALVTAAPAPFVKPGPVVTTGTENLAIPQPNIGRREVVADFEKRTLQVRDALLVARGGKGNIADEAVASQDHQAAGEAQADQDQDAQNADAGAADQQAAQGGKKNKQDQQAQQAAASQQDAGSAASNATVAGDAGNSASTEPLPFSIFFTNHLSR
jgi:hypothetical protein